MAENKEQNIEERKAFERKDDKTIQVRTRNRSKSITVPSVKSKNLRIKMGRLNSYVPGLKQHRGSVQLDSDLESIEEESANISKSRRRSDSDVARDGLPQVKR